MGLFSKPADKKSSRSTNDGIKEDGTETDKWKAKYLRLLDAQEISENTYKETQELLCKTIVRLAIVASGFDPQLEPNLKRIRNHLKNGIDNHNLKAELENITQALTQLNDAPPTGQPTDRDISLLFSFLLQRYTSARQQLALNLLKESCQRLDDPQRLFAAIVEIIEEDRNEILSVNQPSERPPFLQQQIDARFVNGQLLYLLEHIEIPEVLSKKADALKQQLTVRDGATPSFELILDDAISLLIEISTLNQPKQQEIDKFLVHITEQLTELGLAVTGSSIAAMDASLDRSKLDQSVSDQISDLHHRSIHATQLEPLKEVISSRILQITQEIQEHKQKEAVLREKSQCQLDELSQKIKLMEVETGELKLKLIAANTHALQDALTELPNRLAYDERLKIEITGWRRYHTPLCLIVWDIDHFKKINDQYGHQIGDKVLVHVARQFAKHIRNADFIARFGGEEFTMLLPHTNDQAALKLADKLRCLIGQSRLKENDIAIAVTLSCGITQFIDGDTHDSAFIRADQALYHAKEQGRNQCCLA
ncbi:MAG: diguanylate cyclase [Methylovulum sp.]|nr:diguanylate cyclase [Methylovulum sp.]